MVNEQDEQQVSGFSEQWLSLREPADHAARNQMLNDTLTAWASRESDLHIMDFGTGTGSNLRYLCPRLGHDQHWTLVDNDALLLSRLPHILTQWAASNKLTLQQSGDTIHLSNDAFSASVRCQQTDLAHDLSTLPFAATQLLTGSALLDLTSRRWLDQLAGLCIEHRCASLFVLNYDGRMHWQPVLEEDARMRQRLNMHQLNDKGFGDALGPEAGHYWAEQLQAHHQVTVMPSDWRLATPHKALQSALLAGWAEAAIEQESSEQESIEHWKATRQQHLTDNQSTLTVGHTDVLALP